MFIPFPLKIEAKGLSFASKILEFLILNLWKSNQMML